MKEAGKSNKKRIPARSAEARENQLINLAVDLAEKKLLDGSASSQIIVTLLNLGTMKARLELEKAKSDLRVAEAKIEQIKSQESSKDLYEKALAAFREYKGDNEDDYADEDDERY